MVECVASHVPRDWRRAAASPSPTAHHWALCVLALSQIISVAYGDKLCGGHRAPTCADCPQGHGASWCNGDCHWEGGGPRSGRCVDNAPQTDLYELLEIPDSAELADIKKSYRRLSVTYHPDKNPEGKEKFQAIRDAYEVLSNPDKRVLYDTGGMQAVLDAQKGKLEAGESITKELVLSLEDFYRGVRRKVRVSRRVICRLCRRKPDPVKCKGCVACPKIEKRVNVIKGMMMYQQVVHEDSKEDCKLQSTELDVVVDPGTFEGDRIEFKHMASQNPGKIPGHVIVNLRLKPAPLLAGSLNWQRRGSNLRIELEVSLRESLLGFTRMIRHLDGHTLKLSSDTVTAPGQVFRVQGEGMPIKDVPSQFGELDVVISINFPQALTPQARSEVAGLQALRQDHDRLALPDGISRPGKHASDEL